MSPAAPLFIHHRGRNGGKKKSADDPILLWCRLEIRGRILS